MRVLALARYGHSGASSRLRIIQYVEPLRSCGIEVTVQPLLRDVYLERLYSQRRTAWGDVAQDYVRRLQTLLQQARSQQLLWIEKELFPSLPSWFEIGLRKLGVRYLADYDDAVFHGYERGSLPRRWLLHDKIDRVMRNAALVVAGNRYLAARALAAGAARVEIVPTVVDSERYRVGRRSSADPARPRVVGWIGSPSTVRYLELVAPVLASLAAQIPLVLRVVGATFRWPGLPVDCRRWSEASEAAEVQEFDIGIMPLLDTPWERGKCGYKLIQYMACGVPVIASAVGANLDIVEAGRTGFLAQNDSQWASALESLLLNREQAEQMGAAGRDTVERDYCLQVTAPRLAALLREAAVRGGR